MIYSVVLLDGKEIQNLSEDQIRTLFLQRKLNQDSLFRSSENPRWQMLKRGFDLARWAPTAVMPQAQTPTAHNPQPSGNPFQTNAPVIQAQQQAPPQFGNGAPQVTFNQFPPVPKGTATEQTTNGYSQNNQTETYYQAESNQTNYNFQNSQTGFQPSRYNFQTPEPVAAGRSGTKQAAVFVLLNAVGYTILNVILQLSDDTRSAAGNAGAGIGRMTIPIIIDVILAVSLWKQENVETARKWVLARAYIGLVVFGIIVPLAGIQTGEVLIAVFSSISTILYVISIGLTLHGKSSPTPSRLMIGAGTFAIYFLMMFGAIALSTIVKFAPETASLDLPNRQFEKYKVEGREFQDKTTGAKVALPEGWSMISLNNPVVHTPEARMIAVDKDGQSLTMLEVVPVPGNLDMKRQNSTFILDTLADNVVEALKEDAAMAGRGKSNFAEITRLGIFVGKHPAKLLVFEKNVDGEKMKGHMIITYDELTFYVMHSWCPAGAYEAKQADFKHFEQNFVVPEKINSTFTQTAESEKNTAKEKKF